MQIKLVGECSLELAPRGIPNRVLLSMRLKTEVKPANLTTNRAGWLHVLIHSGGRKVECSSRRKEHGGHLSAPTHELFFQKTGLDFSHATQGFDREADRQSSWSLAPKLAQHLWYHIVSVKAPGWGQNRVRRQIDCSAQWETGMSVEGGDTLMAVKTPHAQGFEGVLQLPLCLPSSSPSSWSTWCHSALSSAEEGKESPGVHGTPEILPHCALQLRE